MLLGPWSDIFLNRIKTNQIATQLASGNKFFLSRFLLDVTPVVLILVLSQSINQSINQAINRLFIQVTSS